MYCLKGIVVKLFFTVKAKVNFRVQSFEVFILIVLQNQTLDKTQEK